MPDVRRVGSKAEDQAAEYLLGLGYSLVTRRYRGGGGEIDIIAWDGDVLVFVEVKFRRSGLVAPEAAVDQRKMSRLASAVDSYLASMGGIDVQVRYDVIGIGPNGLLHLVDAFRP